MPEAKKMVRVILRRFITLRVILRFFVVVVTYPMSCTLLRILVVPYPAYRDVFPVVASLHRNGLREATTGNTSVSARTSCSQEA